MLLFLIIGVCMGVALIGWGLMNVRQYDEQMMVRLQRHDLQQSASLTELELQLPRAERILGPLRNTVATQVRKITPKGNIENLQLRLLQAGNPHNLTVQDFLGLKGIAAIAGGIFVFLFFTFVFQPGFGKFIFFMAAGIVGGYFLPDLWIRQTIKKRQEEIQKFLADAIDILAISVEAGQGFDGALGTLSQRKHNALTEEFDRFRLEVQAGKSRRDAFHDLAARAGVEDLANFVAALIQADQLGIGISQVLKAQAEELRIKRRQRAEEKARKAPIKMLFPLILLMFPSLFIVILGPAVPNLMQI